MVTHASPAPNGSTDTTRIIGMSHVASLSRGWADIQPEFPNARISFLDPKEIQTRGEPTDSVVFMLQGNQHNAVGLVEIEAMEVATRQLDQSVGRDLEQWLDTLLPLCFGRSFILLPPPPIEHLEHLVAKRQGNIKQLVARYGLRNAADRLALWRHQCGIIRSVAASRSIPVIELPSVVFSTTGLLDPACCGDELTHGNTEFGRRMMRHIVPWLVSAQEGRHDTLPTPRPAQKNHPYSALPDYAYWQQAVGDLLLRDIDPVVDPRIRITPEDRVATAGSCFAQHLSRRLDAQGLRLLKVENTALDGTPHKPYDFSARYGNLYTARQLLQLFDRAFDHFHPSERVWTRPDGRLCDPFRPRIEAEGYADRNALFSDVEQHLAAVRRMFLELDVLVFTLGMTESWSSRIDGAAYPVAPGVVAGTYLPQQHQFVNFNVSEVVSDMETFLARLAEVNPTARVILTVSPVPMVATREPRHVLVSNTYAKSVLRTAAGQLSDTHDHVEYFPSYEIITATGASNYFAPDRRSVTDAGIEHVMRVFTSRMVTFTLPAEKSDRPMDETEQHTEDLAAEIQAECDEELYRRD